ncbi:MAG: hypothetical protein PVF58_14145 [Candidatus Methanofastidiosia archaeon]
MKVEIGKNGLHGEEKVHIYLEDRNELYKAFEYWCSDEIKFVKGFPFDETIVGGNKKGKMIIGWIYLPGWHYIRDMVTNSGTLVMTRKLYEKNGTYEGNLVKFVGWTGEEYDSIEIKGTLEIKRKTNKKTGKKVVG